MPYSSTLEDKTYKEMGHAEDGSRGTHLHETSGHENSYQDVMAIPRSSDPVERDLRLELELHLSQSSPITNNSPISRSTFATARHGRAEIRTQSGLVHSIEALLLDDVDYPPNDNEYTTRQSCSTEYKIEAALSNAEARTLISTKEHTGFGRNNPAEPAQKFRQGQTYNLPETHNGKRIDPGTPQNSSRDHGRLKAEKRHSEGDNSDDHTYQCRPVTKMVDIPAVSKGPLPDLGQGKNSGPVALQELLYKSSYFRGIGSWIYPLFRISQHCESVSQHRISHPDIASFHEDAVQPSDKTSNGGITECAGNTGSSPPNACGQSTQPSQRLARISKATPTHPKGKRRQLSNDDDGDGDEDGVESGNLAAPKNYHLACPFYKRYSQNLQANPGYKYRTCATTEFPNIPRLKEHLYRVHKQPVTCPRCQEVFKDSDLLESHLQEHDRCPERPRDVTVFISPTLKAQLKIRTLGTNPLEKWKQIYSLIFPGDVVPSSTHQDSPDAKVPMDDTSFISMLSRQIPALLSPELDKLLHDLGLNEPHAAILIDKVLQKVNLCQIDIWKKYQAQQPNHILESSRASDAVDEAESMHNNPADTPFLDPGLVSDIASPHGFHSAGTTYRATDEAQPPQTPFTAGSSTLFATPNLYGSESLRSDSGYGTLTPCGKVLCDESSCGACLDLMRSPTFQKTHLPRQIMADAFTPTDEATDFGALLHGTYPGNGIPFDLLRSSTSQEARYEDYEDDEASYQL